MLETRQTTVRRFTAHCAAGAVLLASAAAVGAAPIVQDAFLAPPYTGAANLDAQNPATTGAASEWEASTAFQVAPLATGGLAFSSSYSTAANTGRAIFQASATTAANGQRIATRGVSAPIAPGDTVATLWVSGLVQFNDTDANGATSRATWGLLGTGPLISNAPGVTNTLGTAAVAGSNLIGFGMINGLATVLPNNDAVLAVNPTTPVGSLTVNINDNATHLFVLKLERNPNLVSSGGTDFSDRLTAWLDPNDGTSEATLDSSGYVAKVTSTAANFWENAEAINRIGVDSNSMTAGAGLYDEIRIGLDVSDVATVPEPAALGLFAAVALPLARRRRRA